MKIGLYGGTFDPVHCGHLIIAQYVRDELSLDKIFFIPTANPPHKQSETPASLRFEMLELAVADNPHFEVSDFEMTSAGVSYTVDTVANFKKKFNLTREELFLIIGSDNFVDFANWREPKKIAQQCHIVVFPRSPGDWEAAPAPFREHAIYLQNAPRLEISSTQIRAFIKQGKAIRYLVPPAVKRFIESRKLYR